jgi:hypothetical protein
MASSSEIAIVLSNAIVALGRGGRHFSVPSLLEVGQLDSPRRHAVQSVSFELPELEESRAVYL